jgi:hypothetical protein
LDNYKVYIFKFADDCTAKEMAEIFTALAYEARNMETLSLMSMIFAAELNDRGYEILSLSNNIKAIEGDLEGRLYEPLRGEQSEKS